MTYLNTAIESSIYYNNWLMSNFNQDINTNIFQDDYEDDLDIIHDDYDDDYIIPKEPPLYVPYEYNLYYRDDNDESQDEIMNEWLLD
jgi:hypothetical protein